MQGHFCLSSSEISNHHKYLKSAPSAKHHRLRLIQKHPSFSIPPHSSSQDLALNIGTLIGQFFGTHTMINPGNTLLNDRALIQIRSNKMGRGTNDLDTALISLMVRLGTLEARQEAMVDIDDLAAHGLAEHRAQHLHVPCEHDKFHVVLLDELQDLALLLGFCILRHGQVVELNAVALRQRLVIRMIGDNDWDIDAQLTGPHAKQQVIKTVANLGHHDKHPSLAGRGTDIVRHFVRGSQLVKGHGQVCGALCAWSGCWTEVDAHEEIFRLRVRKLLEVEDVEVVRGEDAGYGVDDARLVRAGEGEDVVPVGGGHLELGTNTMASTWMQLTLLTVIVVQ